MGERVEHEPATALLSMPLRQSVAVVMERTPLASRWQSERWEAKGVVPDIFGKDAPPRTLYDDGKRLEVLFPGFDIALKGEDLGGAARACPDSRVGLKEMGDFGAGAGAY